MLKNINKTYFGLWLFLLLVGLIGISMKFATGEKLAGYGSYMPWGLWVAMYFHFIGMAGGVAIAGIVGYFANIKSFRTNMFEIGAISFSCLFAGMLSIWLDLGRPFRFVNVFFSPNFGSMLAFNAWMYVVFMAVFVAILYLIYKKSNKSSLKDDTGWLFPLMILALIIAFAFPSQSGAFFGVVDAKPFWNSALLPVLFLISGITSGAAMLLLVFSIIYKNQFEDMKPAFIWIKNIVSGGIIAYLFAEVAEFSLVLWSPNSHSKEAVELIMFGPFWWVFFIVHLGGAILALVMLNNRANQNSLLWGSLVVVVTFISARLNVLIPGQAISELKGLQEAFYNERLVYHYVATLNEYLVAAFIVAFVIALIYAGIFYAKKLAAKA